MLQMLDGNETLWGQKNASVSNHHLKVTLIHLEVTLCGKHNADCHRIKFPLGINLFKIFVRQAL